MSDIIDEQINALKYLKQCGVFPFSDTRTGIIITDECVDSAIDTLHKYQKIKQIINAISYQPRNGYVCGGIFLTDEERVKHIREVIGNGNND